jgi:mono/diheme cytochrome c family protein
MASRNIALSLVSIIVFAGVAANAQTVQRVPVKPTSPASGQQMFGSYCAVCHGMEGKGNGPAAAALKKTPANLTELTQRNGGKFPELRVYGTIKGDFETPAHGSRDMPMWGSVFQSVSHGSSSEVQMRIANLTAYVQSIQAK